MTFVAPISECQPVFKMPDIVHFQRHDQEALHSFLAEVLHGLGFKFDLAVKDRVRDPLLYRSEGVAATPASLDSRVDVGKSRRGLLIVSSSTTSCPTI